LKAANNQSEFRPMRIHLPGITELLSSSIYSTDVVIRELVANAYDAIWQRSLADCSFLLSSASIHVEINDECLSVQDNGIGCSGDEADTFFATLALSSKSGSRDFIGKFGIGFTACLAVAEEIQVITRSAASNAPGVKLEFRPDGTYRIRTVSSAIEPGTRVFLRPKSREWLSEVEAQARRFAEFLPVKIVLTRIGREILISDGGGYAWQHLRSKTDLLAFGRDRLNTAPIDAKQFACPGLQGVFYLVNEGS